MATKVKDLHYLDQSNRFVIWCDIDNTNDGTTADDGYLQGRTISASAWTLETGLVAASSGVASVAIDGVTYAIDTVAQVELTVVDATYVGKTLTARNKITLSDATIENHTLLINIV